MHAAFTDIRVTKYSRTDVSLFIFWENKTEQTSFITLVWFSFLSLLQKNTWRISNHPDIQLFVCHRDLQTKLSSIFLLLVSINNKVYSTNVDTRDKLLVRNFDAAIPINKREVQLRREANDLLTRVANCIKFEGGNFEHLFVTNLPFLCKNFTI